MATNDATTASRPGRAWALGLGAAALLALGVGGWLALARGSGSKPAAGRAYLGVRVVTNRIGPAGAQVISVAPRTPAITAGLRASTRKRKLDGRTYPAGGDVITAVDGSDVSSAADLADTIGALHPGTTILLTYVRGGATTWARVKLAPRPKRLG